MTDYALWEVILNGDSSLLKKSVDGVEQTYPSITAKEKLARKNKLKARGTLLMALPNEHQLRLSLPCENLSKEISTSILRLCKEIFGRTPGHALLKQKDKQSVG
nr:hypothetical protein [Tanacetum cinerariifolium]